MKAVIKRTRWTPGGRLCSTGEGEHWRRQGWEEEKEDEENGVGKRKRRGRNTRNVEGREKGMGVTYAQKLTSVCGRGFEDLLEKKR